MMNQSTDKRYYLAMFVSRNKDNQDVVGFRQRNRTFLTSKSTGELELDFLDFCNRGVRSENCRFYISVNERNHSVIYRGLQHYLIDNPELDLTKMESQVASLAMKENARLTKRFMFDYDGNKNYIGLFLDDVTKLMGADNVIFNITETPNGFAVITEHGFDTRELLIKWGNNVGLKRDGMQFVKIRKNLEVLE